MKDQVEVKGFRFQVYCAPDDEVHIHSPEETEKLVMDVVKFRKKFKSFYRDLERLRNGETAGIENFDVEYDEAVDVFTISLGKEKRKIARQRFLDKMDEFRKLVEED